MRNRQYFNYCRIAPIEIQFQRKLSRLEIIYVFQQIRRNIELFYNYTMFFHFKYNYREIFDF